MGTGKDPPPGWRGLPWDGKAVVPCHHLTVRDIGLEGGRNVLLSLGAD